MSDWLYETRDRRDGITIPTIWVGFVLSLLLHALALWGWRLVAHDVTEEMSDRRQQSAQLNVRLLPPSSPAPAAPRPPIRQPKPPSSPAPPRAPPIITLEQAAPEVRTVAPVAEQPPARPPAQNDLSALIEARRRARAEPSAAASSGNLPNTPPAEDDNAHRERVVAANLAPSRAEATFGYDPKSGGGIFQIQSMGYYRAEFTFFGWNRDIRRNTKQQIEVVKGDHPDIQIAVVRRMIAIIRQYEQKDFTWESHRLGRSLTLSAAQQHNDGLEYFMMREFFEDQR